MVGADIEKRLWAAADQLWANTGLKPSQFSTPVLGLIFLRYAEKRFAEAEARIGPVGSGNRRKISKADYDAEGVIFLRPEARFSHLQQLTESDDIGRAINEAMKAIEEDNPDLSGALPQTYTDLGNDVLVELLRLLAPIDLSGDAFGKVYEYFLGNFAMKEGQKGGVFYTPESIVKLIVEIIEPYHGRILDPACGSGGMFVQSAHFVEAMKANPNERLTFYGMEKNPTTIRLAKMNLAVHGLEGDIQKAISYYEDPHKSHAPFDYVMANPPFNVDEIDAEKMKDDKRLSFGLPGVNKGGKVSNGNYVWMSFFHSYLSDTGRAGIVMSSQASSAGGQEAKVREAMVKTGDMDVMLAIRGNFFYTRTVPCEIWFMDKGKPDHLRDKVLMLDARQVFRKVTRKICDFSPEQEKNLTSIVWLYRGQEDRFAGLLQSYLATAREEAQAADFAPLVDVLAKAKGYFATHADVTELQTGIQKLATDAQAFATAAAALAEPEATPFPR